MVFFSPRNGVVPPSGHENVLRAVVSRVDHDRVVGDAEIVELLEQLSHLPVMFDHAVWIDTKAGLALRFGL